MKRMDYKPARQEELNFQWCVVHVGLGGEHDERYKVDRSLTSGYHLKGKREATIITTPTKEFT